MSKIFLTLLLLGVLLWSLMMTVDATQRHSPHRSHSNRGGRASSTHKPERMNHDVQKGDKNLRLRDRLSRKNRTTTDNTNHLKEDLEEGASINLQLSKTSYFNTNPNKFESNQYDYDSNYRSSDDSIFGDLNSYNGDWNDDHYSASTFSTVGDNYLSTEDHFQYAHEKPLSAISKQVVFEDQEPNLRYETYVEAPIRETQRQVVVENQDYYIPRENYVEQRATYAPQQVLVEHHVTRDNPEVLVQQHVAHERQGCMLEQPVYAEQTHKVIVEEIPAQRPRGVFVGQQHQPLTREVVVQQPYEYAEELIVNHPVRYEKNVVVENVYPAHPQIEYVQSQPEIQYIREDPTWIHDIQLGARKEKTAAVIETPVVVVKTPTVVASTPPIVVHNAPMIEEVPAPIHFAESAVDHTKETAGFPWWLFPIIAFGLFSLGLLLYWLCWKGDDEHESEAMVVQKKRNFVIQKQTKRETQEEIEAEISREMHKRKSGTSAAGLGVSINEEKKLPIRQEAVTSKEITPMKQVHSFSNSVQADSPDDKGTTKRVTKMRRRGKVVAEKHEIIDETGKVIKTHIQKVEAQG